MSTVPINQTNTSSIELDSSTEKEPTSPIPSTSPIVPITVQLPSGAVERSPQGNYVKFNEILGTGSFKTVYRGQNTNAGSLIAWNEVLLKRYGQRERKRIMNEVTMLRTLSHPNLISFYGAFVKKDNKEDEKVVFITELMSSGTLKDFCNKYPIPLKQIKRYCREVLECLHYLHTPQAAAAAAVSNQVAVTGSTTGSTSTTSTSGTTSNVTGTTLGKKSVIHRDLKCDNIFMSTSGKGIKIGDLGLATTDGKSVMGTPEFMAPEMYESGYSTSVDIYAFGLCLLEMVTGKTPYIECTTVIQIYKNVLAGILPENTRVLEHGWPEAYRFLLRCLLPTNLSPSHSQQQQQQQQQQLAATSSSTNTTLLGSNKHSTTTSSSSSLSSITGVAGTQSFEGGVGNVNDGSSGTGSGSKGNVLLRSPSTSSLSSISLLSPTAIATSSSTSSSSSSSSTSNIIISSSSIVRTSSSSSSSATSSASASSSTTPTSSSNFSAVAVTSIGSPFLSSGNNNLTTDGTRINGRSQGSSGSSGSSGSGRSAESVILTTDNIPSVTTSSASQNNQLSNANASNTNQPAQQSLQSLPPPLPTTKASSKSRRLMRPSAAELLLDPFLQPDSTEDGNRTTRDVRELAKEKGYSVITSSTDKNRRSDLSPITLVIALQHQQRLEKELQLRLQTEREEESKRTLQELELKKQQEEALLEEQQRQQKRQEEEEKEEGKKQRQALEQQQEESHYLLEKQRIDEEEAKRVQQQHHHQHQQILRPDDASIVMLLKSQLNTLQQTQQQVLLQTQQAQLQQQAHTEYIQQQSRLLIKSMENEVSQSALLSQLVHAQSAQIQTLLSSQQRTFEEIASIKNSAESSRAVVEWIAKNIRLSTSLSGGGSSNGSSTGGALTPNTSGGGGGGHSSPSSNSPSSVLEHFQLPSSNSSTSGTLISNSGSGVSSPSPPSPSNSSSTPSSSLPSPSSQTNNNVLMSSHGTTINGISHAAFFSPSLPNGTSLLPLYSPPLISSTTTSSNTMMMNTSIDTASHEVARDIGSSTSSSTSSSTTTSSIGGKKLKTKSVSFATENSSSIGVEKEQAPSSSSSLSSSSSGMGLSSSLNDSTHEDGIFSSNTTGNYSLSYLNRHGIGTQNKISIEELSKVSDDDVFIDSSIIDIDELTGEQVIEEMQSHLHQLRLKQFMSEIRQARISAKQLTEIITAKSELSAEYEETIQLESVRHTEELLKMDKQRQELLEKVTPIRLKIAAAAASAAVSSSATLSATTPSSSSSSSLSSSAPVLSDSTSSTENTLVVDSTNDEKTLSMSTISSSQALSIDTFSQSQSTEVGGGGGNTMSSDTSVVSNAIDTFSMEITVRERHEEVLYSRRLDLLDQRQKDEVFRNSDVLKEAQESFEAKSRRLVQREKEIREAFTSRVEKGRSELLLQIQMVCNRDTHTLMSTSEDVSQMGGSSSSSSLSSSSTSTNSTWTETTIIANNGVDIGSNSGTAGIDDGSVNE
jgi:WNK lysine deficient protein kinase